MNIKVLALSVLMFFAMGQALAAPGYYYPRAGYGQHKQDGGPAQTLKEGMSKLIAFIKQNPDADAVGAFVDEEIAPYFDFDVMARYAAGPSYRQMTEQQKSHLAHSIKGLLLSTLSKRLANYSGQDVRYYPPRRVSRNEVKVRVGILQPSGYPANVDFRFYHAEGGWKVFDVSANGNSALSYYRQHFARQMRASR